jgi:hypothetical protein
MGNSCSFDKEMKNVQRINNLTKRIDMRNKSVQ